MIRTIYMLILILIVPFGCKDKESNNTDFNNGVVQSDTLISVTREQFETGNMELGEIKAMNFPEQINTTGFIDVPPSNKAIINSFAGGYIKTTKLLVGDVVKKGQILVTIENPEFIQFQQQFLEAEEQLNYLQNEFERQKTLYEEQITSQKNYLKAESDYKRTLAMRNGLDKKLRILNINPENVKEGIITSTANIYSPINGSVAKIFVSQGSHVSPADKIMEIVDVDHIHLELEVYEKDLMQIKKSQEIIFKIPESSDSTYKGEVHLIGSEIDVTKRTVKVHGHFDSSTEHNFAIGMFVEATIITAEKPVKVLPENAFFEVGDHLFILKLIEKGENSYKFQKLKVDTSNSYDGYVSITNTAIFNASDQFLVNGVYGLIRE